MRRRAAVAAAIVAIIGSLAVGVTSRTSAATPFTDIANSKFTADIDWLYNNGITAGCAPTRYCPKGLVTREQMATFLVRMFHLPSTTEDFFSDDDGSIHESSINRLAASGVTAGCRDSEFCPKGLVTREQMATFISRAAKLSEGAGRDYFWDDNGRIHEDNIDRMAAAGMTTGCDSYRFCPAGLVNREQLAAFLHRVTAPRTPPPWPAPPPPAPSPTPGSGCDPSYPTVCIPPPPPDLDCPQIPYVNFTVIGADPHDFDRDRDGIGCESD